MSKVASEIEAVSGGIVDQQRVDWSRVSPAAMAQAAETIQGLKVLQEIASAFQHAHIAAGSRSETSNKVLFRFAGLDVIDKLGSGANGDVYLAYDPLLDLEVALKLRRVDSESLSHQFVMEARHQARVRHPNVASVYGAAVENGNVGIWMERIHGESIAQRLARCGIHLNEVVSIGVELCLALEAVHQEGLIHGDVKAENVLWRSDGRIFLADFGSACELDKDDSGFVTGTLRSLAPEVVRGGKRSVASDIYAVGVLLYRLVGGRYPYDASSTEALLKQQRSEAVPLRNLNRRAPPTLCAIIDRCLRRDPHDRPTNARQVRQELAACLSQGRSIKSWLSAAAGLAGIGAAFVALWVHYASSPVWSSDLTLYRVESERPTPIHSADSVAVGNGLQVVYESNKQSWLYVLDDDGTGVPAVLYPDPQLIPNPIASGARVSLPQTVHQQLSWLIGSQGSREELLIIASRQPLPAVEGLIKERKAIPAPSTQRSISGLSAAPTPVTFDSKKLEALLGELKRTNADDIRYWQFELPHR